MTNIDMLLILFGSFFLMGYLGVPIALALGLSSFITAMFAGVSSTLVIQQMYRGVDTFPLLAIPFFLVLAEILNTAVVTERLTKFADSLVGHIRGGLAHVNVLVSMILAGMSGSSTADTAAVGAVMIPAMIKAGYSKAFTVALTASASCMGSIIPPSIMAIVYGATSGVSVAGIFLGGVIPGILIGGGQMAISYRYAVREGLITTTKPSLYRIMQSTRKSILALFIPIILIGGIVGGAFTPTEAGMVASIYALLISIAIYRTLRFSQLPNMFSRAGRQFAVIMFTVGLATPFAWLIAYLGLPDVVAKMALDIGHTRLIVFAFLITLFVILGDFLDATPSIIIFYPIVKALGDAAGIHPVHMGVLVVVTLSFGFITPPYGLTLLLASGIAGITFTSAMRALLIFYAAFLIVIIITAAFPDMVLLLPRLLLPNFR